MKPDSPIREIKGIGPKTEQLFNSMGVYTVGDILLYFPRDYELFPDAVTADGVVPGEKNAVLVRAAKAPEVNTRSAMSPAVLDVEGKEGRLRVIWFRSPYVRSLIRAGGRYVLYGKVTEKENLLFLEQPEIFSPEEYEKMGGMLRPVYALTKGIGNKQVMRAVRLALDALPEEEEYLPEDIRERNRLPGYRTALKDMHLPADRESCIAARDRFVFEEFFFFFLAMHLRKGSSVSLENGFSFGDYAFIEELADRLPYELTGAQRRTLEEIRDDLRSPGVMQRLVQGDVGSGKTIIAFLAMLDCAHSGYQAALMAPTEVLARQHFQKLKALCESFGLGFFVVLLTGSLTAAGRREAYETIKREPSALIVGTQALIQEKVEYAGLALVITDEQHRFGVKQREAFSSKGAYPHILVMSATPIPRTLAIILYGDLDISVIDEVPAKRIPIKNCVVDPSYRNTAYRFIEREVRAGHQAYVICPLVESSERSEGENVRDYAESLRKIFPEDIRIGELNGRMKPEEKNRITEEFSAGRIKILVSTTVIEVGVDVPNATVMMVENAERFGLAQLHQLRGRVGRGEARSYCIFMKGSDSGRSGERLEILNRSDDGFFIAEEDLKLRGPGDFLGIRQSGDLGFKIADIYQDSAMMRRAAREAEKLLKEDPGLKDPSRRLLRGKLREYAGEDPALFNI